MKKHGLAIMIADKMPPPHLLGKRHSPMDEADGDDEEEGGDEEDEQQMAEDCVKDAWSAMKQGDWEAAVSHFRDLFGYLDKDEDEEEDGEEHEGGKY